MATSGIIERQFHGSGSGYYFGLEWRVNSQSKASNSSNVTATVFIRTQGSGYTINSSATKTVSVTINGTKYLGECTVGVGTNSRKNLFSKTVDVPHNGDGTKTCDFACALDIQVTLGGTWYGKITHSGQGTFDKINLNSAPWWTSDDTHITCWSQTLKADTIIPENTGDVIVTSATAWDNEQGGNLNYDLHRHINGNYSAQVKWGGSGIDVTDNLSNWGAGTVIKYEAKVHDGQGLWAPGSRWSWTYTKNRFSPATVGDIGSIGPNQNTLTFTAYSARNQGGICNNNYGYRITSLTPGVNVYGNREVGQSSITDVHFILGVKNNGGAVPTNPHWLDANEIKAYLASSGYNGNIRLRIESWNSYGSSGNADFNVWVDLRKDIPYTTIRHDAGWVTHKNNNYYIPAYLPIDISWDTVTDPMGGTISYEVLYQIGEGAWVFLADTGTSTRYKANLASVIGNVSVNNFRFIVRAKTTYGKRSESGGPRVTLHNYSPPTVRINEVTRNKTDATVKGSLQINTSIGGGTPSSAIYSLNNGSNISFLNVINQGGGNPFAYSFTTGTLDSSKSYALSILATDTIGDAIKAKGITISAGNGTYTIPVYTPIISLRKNVVRINTPLEVAGSIKSNGVTLGGFEENSYRQGLNLTYDEDFKYGTNGINVYNNTGNGNVVHELITDNQAPNKSKRVLKITNKGDATPGWGGFNFGNNTYASAVFTYIITAKIPSGRRINWAANAFGDGSRIEWLTSVEGTDDWSTYVCRAYCGKTGTFNSIGYFYISGGSSGFSWYLAAATYFDTNYRPVNIQMKSDGVIEIGKYLDFHSSPNIGNGDYSIRIESEQSGSFGSGDILSFSSNLGTFKIGNQNGSWTHLETDRPGFYIKNKVNIANTLTVAKGSEGNGEYSQIFFPAQGNDSGRIIHWERNNTAQLWLIPSDDPTVDTPDRVTIGTLSGNDTSIGGQWTNKIDLYADGRAWFARHVIADNFQAQSNAAGTNFKIGDDVWIGDANIANGFRVSGVGNWNYGKIQFGNGGWIGYQGGNALDMVGDIWMNGNRIALRPNNGVGVELVFNSDATNSNGQTEPTLVPSSNGHGVIGRSGQRFYVIYSNGGSISSKKANKYDIRKYDDDILYDYLKDINIYAYRNISGNEGEERLYRQDLRLGTMVDELPYECVMYDMEGNDEPDSLEIYSYASMIAGALKHTMAKLEDAEDTIYDLTERLERLEEKDNGTI